MVSNSTVEGILGFIKSHPMSKAIEAMFRNSPSDNRYWMYRLKDNTALSVMRTYLHACGFVEESYGRIMRTIEHRLKTDHTTSWANQLPSWS